MAKQPTSTPAPASGTGVGADLNQEISALIAIAVGLFILFATFKFLAWMAIYLYTPFTYLPLKALIELGSFGAMIVFLIYALLCVVADFLIGQRFKKAERAKIDPERSHGFWYLAGFWVLMAVYVLFNSDPTDNAFFRHIYYVCNPTQIDAPFATCTANFQSVVLQSSMFEIMKATFMPNLVFVIPVLPEIVRGFIKIVDHPKNNAIGARTVEQLIGISKLNFSHLHFYSKIDPRKYSLDNGPFALLRQSRQYATEQGLIDKFIKRPDSIQSIRSIGHKQEIKSEEQALSQSDTDTYIPVVNSERFEHLMLKQLGSVWTGDVDDLSPEEVMIMAVIVPQCCTIEKEMSAEEAEDILNNTRKRMDGIWEWLASCLDDSQYSMQTNDTKRWPDGYDLSKLPPLSNYPKYEEFKKELQNTWFKHPVMQDIVEKHAYVNTVLYAATLNARSVGVLQPSSTRWLKLYDRALFALIQNVGRPSVFAENMGSVSHYYAEKRNKHRLLRPEFQAAYTGFSERLSMFLYTEEDKRAFDNGTLKYTINYREKGDSFNPEIHAKKLRSEDGDDAIGDVSIR